MTHNWRCEYADPSTPCKCSCHGKLHGIKYGQPHPTKKHKSKSTPHIPPGQLSIDEFIED